MNANDMVRKLFIVEKDPNVIWKAIENIFGFGFFYKIIEEEYGIKPNFLEKFKKDLANEFNMTRAESNQKLNKLSN